MTSHTRCVLAQVMTKDDTKSASVCDVGGLQVGDKDDGDKDGDKDSEK